MTIIVFLIDTSASMNQRTYFGPTFLDLAKGAVETFLKFRSRDPSSRGVDRYMLLTFDEPPKNIKAGWKENQATFIQELKSLKASVLTTVGAALGNVFHLLNVNRLQYNIDNFGFGRYPHRLEPAVILVITDGGSLTNNVALSNDLEVPTSSLPGSELYREPFRWDQRIFSLVLRLPGHASKSVPPPGGLIPPDFGPMEAMCDATGGRSYCVTSQKMLNQCLESLVQKVQTGVVVCFEKDKDSFPVQLCQDENKVIIENGFVQHQMDNNAKLVGNLPDHLVITTADTVLPTAISPENPEPAWYKTRKMLYVLRSGGRSTVASHWPLPEPFWPEPTNSTLPCRSAHPVIKFKCDPSEPVSFEGLPYDKYELEPSPLTQFILERKQPSSCWQVFTEKSGKYADLGQPFGYLKASSSLNCVNLFVMPYNYPVLIPLLDELKNTFKGKPNTVWRAKFDKYVRLLPPYYLSPLKTVLIKNGFASVLPEQTDSFLSYNVVAYFNKIKHRAHEEFEILCKSVAQHLQSSFPTNFEIKVIPRSQRLIARGDLQLSSDDSKSASDQINNKLAKAENASDFNGFRIHLRAATANVSQPTVVSASMKPSSEFRNPFDIPRTNLLQQLAKMRINFAQHLSSSSIPVLEGGLPGANLKLQNAEELHRLPIALMGNYQDYLKLMPTAPKLLENTPIRQHAFGNPFKVDKRMLVDEADIDAIVGNSNVSGSSSVGGSSSSRTLKKLDSSKSSSSSYSSGSSGCGSFGGLKRKAGPLPRDFRYVRSKRRRESVENDIRNHSPLCIDEDSSFSFTDASDNESQISSDAASPRSDHDRLLEVVDDTAEQESSSIPETTEMPHVPIENDLYIEDSQMPNISSNADDAVLSPKIETKRPRLNSVVEKHLVGEKFDPLLLPDLKRRLSICIRKPGSEYRQISEIIKSSSGVVRETLVKWALQEASRFKREKIQEELQKLIGRQESLETITRNSKLKHKYNTFR